MRPVNQATQGILAQFRDKAAVLPYDAHPYVTAAKGLKNLGLDDWTEQHQAGALEAMALWVEKIVRGSVVITLNEIVALMRVAVGTGEADDKAAADNMASSMTFVENVFTAFVSVVEFDYVAEQLFADGQKLEKERREEFAAAEAAKAKVAPAPGPKPLAGTIRHRWEPSQN